MIHIVLNRVGSVLCFISCFLILASQAVLCAHGNMHWKYWALCTMATLEMGINKNLLIPLLISFIDLIPTSRQHSGLCCQLCYPQCQSIIWPLRPICPQRHKSELFGIFLHRNPAIKKRSRQAVRQSWIFLNVFLKGFFFFTKDAFTFIVHCSSVYSSIDALIFLKKHNFSYLCKL